MKAKFRIGSPSSFHCFPSITEWAQRTKTQGSDCRVSHFTLVPRSHGGPSEAGARLYRPLHGCCGLIHSICMSFSVKSCQCCPIPWQFQASSTAEDRLTGGIQHLQFTHHMLAQPSYSQIYVLLTPILHEADAINNPLSR